MTFQQLVTVPRHEHKETPMPHPNTPPATRKRLLVIEPMSSGLTLLGAARDLGLETVVFSHDAADRVVPEGARGEIDLFVAVDTNDPAALAEAAAEVHARTPLSGVVSGSEFYVDAAARLAHLLGLAGQPIETAEAVRDKTLMRAMLAKAGIRIPRYAEVLTAADLDDAAETVGFPCVLKPAAGSGSIQVSRVEDSGQLKSAYRTLADHADFVFDQPEDGRALVEQYLVGPEYSVEGYVHQGRVTIVSVTRKLLGAEPYFVELGHVVRADLAPDVRSAVEDYTSAVVTCLGIALGPFHAELRLTNEGPVLIEVGARLAGDRIAELITLATGVSLRHVMVASHVGLDPESAWPRALPAAEYAGVHFFTAPGLTTLHRIEGLDALERHPSVAEVRMYLGPGDSIPAARDLRCRLGHVIFTADSADQEAELRAWAAATARFA
ncbi:ATP-grasp domain-containing protein [Streptomyces sp. NPDC007100]|uniref:ATP-grasp domain-containing protein n=1 Tax=Streptomyces sp. NPDC007100 TaxID=3155602 RepID=UPI0033E686C0